MTSPETPVTLEEMIAELRRYLDGFDLDDRPNEDILSAILATLEAMQDKQKDDMG